MPKHIHYEVLDPQRKKFFLELHNFRKEGYLAGGTALALQIAHRYSYDFDIFCYQPIKSSLILKSKRWLAPTQILVNNAGEEYTFLTKTAIKVTFFHDGFSFPGKMVATPGLPLLSVLNIASAKAFTLNYRGKYRDYVDLYTIIKSHRISLERIIKNAQRIYGQSFSEKLFLGQLVYMEDLSPSDIKSVQWIGQAVSKATIHHFFQQQVRRYLKDML